MSTATPAPIPPLENCKKFGPLQKLVPSLISAGIFFVLVNPWMFEATNKIFGGKLFTKGDCPQPGWASYALHALVFLIIIYLIMAPWKKTSYSCSVEKKKK